MTIRTQLKGGRLAGNHNEALQVRSAITAGRLAANHNETLKVRSALKAGKLAANHNEALQVRSAIKAGKLGVNHNERVQRAADQAVSMRRELLTTTRKEDRLELLVVRAGLRAGRRSRGRARK